MRKRLIAIIFALSIVLSLCTGAPAGASDAGSVLTNAAPTPEAFTQTDEEEASDVSSWQKSVTYIKGSAGAAWSGTMEARLGYDGQITFLRSLPLAVSVKNDGESLTDAYISVKLTRSQTEYDTYRAPVSIAKGAKITVTLPIYPTTRQDSYDVELTKDGQTLATVSVSPLKTFHPSTIMVGVISDSPDALRYMDITAENDTLSRAEYWRTTALNAKNFPESRSLLDSFTFLVIDGADVSVFSDKQRAALNEWLENGGIIFVGGGAQGAAGYSYFSKWTGLTAGAPYEAADVSPELMSYLSYSGAPTGASAMLCAIEGDALPILGREGTPLIYLLNAGNGLIFETTFSLSDKPLSAFLEKASFFQRLVLLACNTAYMNIVSNMGNYYGPMVNNNTYLDSSITSSIAVDNKSTLILPLVLLLVFLFGVLIAGYFILKKLDKREWLWLIIPLCALLCAGSIHLLCGFVNMREPIAVNVTKVTVSGGSSTASTTSSLSSASSTALSISADNADITLPLNSNGDTSTYTEDDQALLPIKSRYVYTFGDTASLTMPVNAPWSVCTVRSVLKNPLLVSINASIHMESDGLHAEITNNSGFTFPSGYLITGFGYVTVPSVAPGETVRCAILRDEERDKKLSGQIDGDNRGAILNGVMLSNEQTNYISVDTIMSAAVYPENESDPWENKPAIKYDQSHAETFALLTNQFDYYSASYKSTYKYMFICKDMAAVDLYANGLPIKRKVDYMTVNADVTFIHVSQDGTVNFPSGTVPLTMADIDKADKPQYTGEALSRTYWYSAPPENGLIFSFTVPKEAIGMTATVFSLTYDNLSNCKVQIYNVQTAAWDDIATGTSPKTDMFGQYVDAQGHLFIRYMQDTASGLNNSDTYYGIPRLQLEGRCK